MIVGFRGGRAWDLLGEIGGQRVESGMTGPVSGIRNDDIAISNFFIGLGLNSSIIQSLD